MRKSTDLSWRAGNRRNFELVESRRVPPHSCGHRLSWVTGGRGCPRVREASTRNRSPARIGTATLSSVPQEGAGQDPPLTGAEAISCHVCSPFPSLRPAPPSFPIP